VTALTAYDLDRGDRKEVVELLGRLTLAEQGDFLRWCCRQVRGPEGAPVALQGAVETTTETYLHLVTLWTTFGLAVEASRAGLLRRVKARR
jgi:hypothetical protein